MAMCRKEARAAKARALAKFERLAVMNRLIDGGEVGVYRAKKALSDSWTKRQSNNVTGFYDPRKAKANHGVR